MPYKHYKDSDLCGPMTCPYSSRCEYETLRIDLLFEIVSGLASAGTAEREDSKMLLPRHETVL
jgi:hypothetical protein